MNPRVLKHATALCGTILASTQPLTSAGVHPARTPYKVLRRLHEFAKRLSANSFPLYVTMALTAAGLWVMCESHSHTSLVQAGKLNLTGTQKSDARQFPLVPSGTLMVVCVCTYTLFINSLANLSFSELHLNITARMWQQGFIVAYIAMGACIARVAFALLCVMRSSRALEVLSTGFCCVAAVCVCTWFVARSWAAMDHHDVYAFR